MENNQDITMSSLSPNPVLSISNRRKRKKKIHPQSQTHDPQNDSPIQWKSDTQQQIYSSKLLRALRQVRRRSEGEVGSNSSSPVRFREAADRVLAATAKGRSRWSRAILTNRLKLKFMKKNNIVKRQRKVINVITTSSRKKSKVSVLGLKSKGLPAVQRKARVLSTLVPGCRRQPLPVVLEEVTDYIPALEMQIRAMSAIFQLLSGGATTESDSQITERRSSEPPLI